MKQEKPGRANGMRRRWLMAVWPFALAACSCPGPRQPCSLTEPDSAREPLVAGAPGVVRLPVPSPECANGTSPEDVVVQGSDPFNRPVELTATLTRDSVEVRFTPSVRGWYHFAAQFDTGALVQRDFLAVVDRRDAGFRWFDVPCASVQRTLRGSWLCQARNGALVFRSPGRARELPGHAVVANDVVWMLERDGGVLWRWVDEENGCLDADAGCPTFALDAGSFSFIAATEHRFGGIANDELWLFGFDAGIHLAGRRSAPVATSGGRPVGILWGDALLAAFPSESGTLACRYLLAHEIGEPDCRAIDGTVLGGSRDGLWMGPQSRPFSIELFSIDRGPLGPPERERHPWSIGLMPQSFVAWVPVFYDGDFFTREYQLVYAPARDDAGIYFEVYPAGGFVGGANEAYIWHDSDGGTRVYLR